MRSALFLQCHIDPSGIDALFLSVSILAPVHFPVSCYSQQHRAPTSACVPVRMAELKPCWQIGRMFFDETVQSDIKLWPFEIVNRDGKPLIEIDDAGETKTLTPEEVCNPVESCLPGSTAVT